METPYPPQLMGRQKHLVASDTHAAVQDLVSACNLLVTCSGQVENEPLKNHMQQAMLGIAQVVGGKCREFTTFLVSALVRATESPESATEIVLHDIVWTLHTLSEQSVAARTWIAEAGGAAAAAKALSMHPSCDNLTQEGTSLVYELAGIRGLMDMMRHTDSAVQAAAVWQIYERCKEWGETSLKNSVHWPEASSLVVGLIEVMQNNLRSKVNVHVLWACSSALRRLLAAERTRSRLFCASGGIDTLIATVRVAHSFMQQTEAETRELGEGLLTAATRLAMIIADGNEEVILTLRRGGMLQVLIGEQRQGLQSQATEDIMWVVGQVSGINAVLEAMSQVSFSQQSVHGGLAILAEMVWSPSIEFQHMYKEYVTAAPFLLELVKAAQASLSDEDRALALKALGGVLYILAPHVQPGAWKCADDAIAILVEAVRTGHDTTVVTESAECLGRVAMISPVWRELLRQTLTILSSRLRAGGSIPPAWCEGLQKKYIFWAMAAIAGLPVVIEEMRQQTSDPQVQDAAICAICNILEDDVGGECDYSLKSALEPADGARLREAFDVVVAAMKLHADFVTVQSRGSWALGLLQTCLPQTEPVKAEVLEVVLDALWRHKSDHRVMYGVSRALRAFLERHAAAHHNGNAPNGLPPGGVAASLLRSHDTASSGLWELIDTFTAPTRSMSAEELSEMLEDSLFVLALLNGVPRVCEAIASKTHLHACGLKALFEVLRTFPELATAETVPSLQQMLQIVFERCMARKKVAKPGFPCPEDVQRHIEMLKGLTLASSSTA